MKRTTITSLLLSAALLITFVACQQGTTLTPQQVADSAAQAQAAVAGIQVVLAQAKGDVAALQAQAATQPSNADVQAALATSTKALTIAQTVATQVQTAAAAVQTAATQPANSGNPLAGIAAGVTAIGPLTGPAAPWVMIAGMGIGLIGSLIQVIRKSQQATANIVAGQGVVQSIQQAIASVPGFAAAFEAAKPTISAVQDQVPGAKALVDTVTGPTPDKIPAPTTAPAATVPA